MPSKSFDLKSLQKFANPNAVNDFSKFLDTIPAFAGKGVLIAAGIAWAVSATLGLFTVMQTKELTEMRTALQAEDTLKPIVPVITMTAVPDTEISRIAEEFKKIYPNLTISLNGGIISIKSRQTADFAQFREAVGHIINGGKGWKVSVESFCVGRECKESGLGASLKIQKLNIDKPTI